MHEIKCLHCEREYKVCLVSDVSIKKITILGDSESDKGVNDKGKNAFFQEMVRVFLYLLPVIIVIPFIIFVLLFLSPSYLVIAQIRGHVYSRLYSPLSTTVPTFHFCIARKTSAFLPWSTRVELRLLTLYRQTLSAVDILFIFADILKILPRTYGGIPTPGAYHSKVTARPLGRTAVILRNKLGRLSSYFCSRQSTRKKSNEKPTINVKKITSAYVWTCTFRCGTTRGAAHGPARQIYGPAHVFVWLAHIEPVSHGPRCHLMGRSGPGRDL